MFNLGCGGVFPSPKRLVYVRKGVALGEALFSLLFIFLLNVRMTDDFEFWLVRRILVHNIWIESYFWLDVSRAQNYPNLIYIDGDVAPEKLSVSVLRG